MASTLKRSSEDNKLTGHHETKWPSPIPSEEEYRMLMSNVTGRLWPSYGYSRENILPMEEHGPEKRQTNKIPEDRDIRKENYMTKEHEKIPKKIETTIDLSKHCVDGEENYTREEHGKCQDKTGTIDLSENRVVEDGNFRWPVMPEPYINYLLSQQLANYADYVSMGVHQWDNRVNYMLPARPIERYNPYSSIDQSNKRRQFSQIEIGNNEITSILQAPSIKQVLFNLLAPSIKQIPSSLHTPSSRSAPITKLVPSISQSPGITQEPSGRLLPVHTFINYSDNQTPSVSQVRSIKQAPSVSNIPSIMQVPSIRYLPSIKQASHIQIIKQEPSISQVPSISQALRINQVPRIKKEPSISHVPCIRQDSSISQAPSIKQEPSQVPSISQVLSISQVPIISRSRDRKKRSNFENHQIIALEKKFEETHYPTKCERELLGEESGLEIKTVTVWFQNRRAKEKLKAWFGP